MIRTGRVVEANQGSLKVCFDRPEMCASCGKCGVHGEHQELVTVDGEAAAGSWVQVEMPDAQVVKVSLIAYVIPLVFLMAGLVIGQNVLGSDGWAAGLGVGLLAQEDYETAAGYFSNSIEHGEQVTSSFYNRGICFLKLGFEEAAAADMQSVIALGDDADLSAQAQVVLDSLAGE